MGYECKCEVCGQGPQQNVSIYRTGGKGPGINPHWRCECHAGAPIPDDLYAIVGTIEHATQQANTEQSE